MIFPDEIEIITTAGYGAYGEVPGQSRTARARVEPSGRLVRGRNGDEIVAELRAFVPRGTPVAAGDTVRYNGRDYIVLLAAAYRLLRGTSHLELELGPR